MPKGVSFAMKVPKGVRTVGETNKIAQRMKKAEKDFAAKTGVRRKK